MENSKKKTKKQKAKTIQQNKIKSKTNLDDYHPNQWNSHNGNIFI